MRTWLKITGIMVGVGLAAFLVEKTGRLTVSYLEKELDRQKRLTAERFAEFAPTSLVMKGFGLTKDQVREHEKTLEEKPTDMQARCLLLGYYRGHSKPGSRDRKRLHAHALWIIENRPQTPMARECELLPWLDGDTVYEMGKQIWLTHCESHKTDCRILSNAAKYLLLEDRLIAEQLILQGKQLQPDNPEWSDRLAHLYDLGLDGVDEAQCANMALKERKTVYELSKKQYSLFNLLKLKRLPELALKAEQYDDAISDSKNPVNGTDFGGTKRINISYPVMLMNLLNLNPSKQSSDLAFQIEEVWKNSPVEHFVLMNLLRAEGNHDAAIQRVKIWLRQNPNHDHAEQLRLLI